MLVGTIIYVGGHVILSQVLTVMLLCDELHGTITMMRHCSCKLCKFT